MGRLDEVAKSGRSVFLVSHNMAVVAAFCNYALLIEQGKTVRFDAANVVVNDYIKRSNASAAGKVDLTRRPNRDNARSLSLIELEFLDSEGNSAGAFPIFSPIRFRISFRSAIAGNNFVVGLSVSALDGTVLWTSASDDSGEQWSISPGTFNAECKLTPNILRAGVFSVSIGCDANGLNDTFENAAIFEIVASSPHSNSRFVSTPGSVHLNLPWSLEQTQEALN
jgi:lipopolysaccharide transport system ATP-binding protein